MEKWTSHDIRIYIEMKKDSQVNISMLVSPVLLFGWKFLDFEQISIAMLYLNPQMPKSSTHWFAEVSLTIVPVHRH
jgi:hypothetical protein